MAYVIDPTLFTTVRGPVRVLTEGPAIGHTMLDRRQKWSGDNAWVGQPAVNVCVDVDVERLLALYFERVTTPD